jgi:membrane-bound lytic murein transglycosylase D
MQWKIIFCSVIAFTPFIGNAQGPNPKAVSDGKKIAMRESSESGDRSVSESAPLILDSLAPKAMPFAMSSNSKTVGTDLKSDHKLKNPSNGNEKSYSVSSGRFVESKLATPRPLDRVWEENEKFKPVPLAGETEYYGNMNSVMIEYVRKYMTNFAGRLNVVSGRGVNTFEVIDKVLKSYSIPKELKYLAVIESALNKNARSPVGALGYWQFMAPTAKLMGLTVNGRRDDRTDLSKSTHAAAKYLTYLYDMLDDWLLVVAAYNSGPRPVINAIKKTGKNDFWAIKSYLPKETQNHVMAFVATATIMERLNHFLLPGVPVNFDWGSLNVTKSDLQKQKKPANPLLSKFSEEEIKQMAIVRIKNPIDLEVVSSVLSIDRRQLGKWNYDYFEYLETYKKGEVYNFRLPKDKLDAFIEKKDIIERASTHMRL